MNGRNKYKGEKAKTILDVCRGSQVIVASIVLALSIILSARWDKQSNACGDSQAKECEKVNSAIGGLKYCISVGAYGLFDVGVWLVDTCWISLPWWAIYGSAQLTGGMALGGGSTLAAVINGWNCENGDNGPFRMCHQYYADIALQYVLTIIAWIGIVAWCYARQHYRPDVCSRMS